MVLLVVLYAMQGVPLGLTMGAMCAHFLRQTVPNPNQASLQLPFLTAARHMLERTFGDPDAWQPQPWGHALP